MKKTLILLILAVAGVAVAQGLQPRSRSGLLRRPGAPGAPTAQAAAPAAGADASVDELADGSSLNFNQTAIDLVFEAYGRMIGKTILKDPQCPSATITLKSEKGQKLTQEEQIEAIEVVLEMNGVHLEPYGEKFMRALPRKDARKEGIPLYLDPDKELRESGKVISMMLPFKNISMEDAQKILDQFKSATGILIAIERTNSILITDTEMNIKRMCEVAKTIDVATPVLENVFVRQIKNANATEIKTALEAIVQESQKELEKSKGANANVAQPSNNMLPRPGGLLGGGLRRPGQNGNQPQAPAANSSLVISDADRGMIRGKVLILADERSNKLIIVTQRANMDFFDKVIEQLDVETTPDTVVKVYRLKYAEAEDVSDMINDLIGNSVSSKNSGKNSQNQNAKKGTGGNITRSNTPAQTTVAKKPANQRTGEAKAGELSKENTTVLADKRINGLVVMTMKELVPTIEQIIESMDIKLSQVLIETMIIEVTLGDDLYTGMDWIQHGRERVIEESTDAIGRDTFKVQRTTTTYKDGAESGSVTEYLDKLVPEGYSTSKTSYDSDGKISEKVTETASSIAGTVSRIATDGLLNYYSGGTATAIAGGQGGQTAYNIAKGVTSNVFGKAFNFVFTSDELGLSAYLQASKTDSRSKYIASPIIMTLDNKEAIIEATSKRQFLTGWNAVSGYNGSGMPSPNYSSEDIGIKIKATPKINPNGTVMLEVEEEYSQVGGKQTMLTPVGGETYTEKPIDVPSTRKMSSDVILENNQTVVFGGLTQKYTAESETGIPILKDIPYIGKWLFGTVEQTETRTELLVFMTPYVLDDAQATQAEAIRRKKTMSDPRAWEDNGWSASVLADPVSKKEQMRRLKDEWKKQDEERQTRLEIEKEKIKRAEKLKEMSAAEREQWLKLHKEELEKEQQEELEKKMLDKDSQEELKKLVADVRATKLKEAEAELKKAEEETSSQNERAKLDAEKKAKKEAEKEMVEKVGGGGEGEPAEVKPVEVKPVEVKPAAGAGGLADLAAETK